MSHGLLVVAVKAANREAIKLLIENLKGAAESLHLDEKATVARIVNGGDVGSEHREPKTALMWAAENAVEIATLLEAKGQDPLAIVMDLLAWGADPELVDDTERTALHYAIKSGYIKLIDHLMKLLCEKYHDQPARLTKLLESNGAYALQLSQYDFVKIFEGGTNSQDLALAALSEDKTENYLKTIRIILKGKCNPNQFVVVKPFRLKFRDDYFKGEITPLISAIHALQVKGVELLLNPNSEEKEGKQQDLVKANVNVANNQGFTAIYFAFIPTKDVGTQIAIIKLLIRAGADLTVRDKNGMNLVDLLHSYHLRPIHVEIAAMLTFKQFDEQFYKYVRWLINDPQRDTTGLSPDEEAIIREFMKQGVGSTYDEGYAFFKTLREEVKRSANCTIKVAVDKLINNYFGSSTEVLAEQLNRNIATKQTFLKSRPEEKNGKQNGGKANGKPNAYTALLQDQDEQIDTSLIVVPADALQNNVFGALLKHLLEALKIKKGPLLAAKIVVFEQVMCLADISVSNARKIIDFGMQALKKDVNCTAILDRFLQIPRILLEDQFQELKKFLQANQHLLSWLDQEANVKLSMFVSNDGGLQRIYKPVVTPSPASSPASPVVPQAVATATPAAPATRLTQN